LFADSPANRFCPACAYSGHARQGLLVGRENGFDAAELFQQIIAQSQTAHRYFGFVLPLERLDAPAWLSRSSAMI
jgi:hypothetical protein